MSKELSRRMWTPLWMLQQRLKRHLRHHTSLITMPPAVTGLSHYSQARWTIFVGYGIYIMESSYMSSTKIDQLTNVACIFIITPPFRRSHCPASIIHQCLHSLRHSGLCHADPKRPQPSLALFGMHTPSVWAPIPTRDFEGKRLKHTLWIHCHRTSEARCQDPPRLHKKSIIFSGSVGVDP